MGDVRSVVDAVEREAHEIGGAEQQHLLRRGGQLELGAQPAVGEPERLGAAQARGRIVLRACRIDPALGRRAQGDHPARGGAASGLGIGAAAAPLTHDHTHRIERLPGAALPRAGAAQLLGPAVGDGQGERDGRLGPALEGEDEHPAGPLDADELCGRDVEDALRPPGVQRHLERPEGAGPGRDDRVEVCRGEMHRGVEARELGRAEQGPAAVQGERPSGGDAGDPVRRQRPRVRRGEPLAPGGEGRAERDRLVVLGSAPSVRADVAVEVVVVGHEVPGVAPVPRRGQHQMVEAGGLQIRGDQAGPGEDLAAQRPVQPVRLGDHERQVALGEDPGVVAGLLVEGGCGIVGVQVHRGHHGRGVAGGAGKLALPGAGDDRHLDAVRAGALGQMRHVLLGVRAVEEVQLVLDLHQRDRPSARQLRLGEDRHDGIEPAIHGGEIVRIGGAQRGRGAGGVAVQPPRQAAAVGLRADVRSRPRHDQQVALGGEVEEALQVPLRGGEVDLAGERLVEAPVHVQVDHPVAGVPHEVEAVRPLRGRDPEGEHRGAQQHRRGAVQQQAAGGELERGGHHFTPALPADRFISYMYLWPK